MRLYSRITGTGSCLPSRRLTNADLADELAVSGVVTTDDWIVERTGIRARHFAAAGVCSSDLGFEAAQKALQAAKLLASDIDLIIVATSTPDMVFPSTACILQNKLGAHGCAAFDVQAVCSGFIYALTIADAMIKAGSASKALVIGAEVFSRLLDFKDRTTCVLFGDGAGAAAGGSPASPGCCPPNPRRPGMRKPAAFCAMFGTTGGKSRRTGRAVCCQGSCGRCITCARSTIRYAA